MTEQLTREKILSMQPGWELDALVAEQVMGYTTYGQFRDKDGVRVMIDRYSADIAAAFEAEAKAIEKDPSMYIHALASVVFGYNQVQDISDIRKICMLIHATPEQRCKAALLAVMEE